MAVMIGRSREGAWIEISATSACFCCALGRSREGAWIEIEFRNRKLEKSSVAPARERGLKFKLLIMPLCVMLSLPRGSVD